jgi:hypothetical protein
VFANHRLKSLWALHAASQWLTPSNLAQGIYTHGTMSYVENGAIQTLSGALSTWPNASNAPSGSINYWTTGSGASRRDWQLNTTLTTDVTGAQPPILRRTIFPSLSASITPRRCRPTISLAVRPPRRMKSRFSNPAAS